MTCGVVVASSVALALLVIEPPTARNLVVAVVAGFAFGVGSWLYLERH